MGLRRPIDMGVITPQGYPGRGALEVSKGNPFLALRLTHDQQDALRASAAESGQTVSDLVRHVLADYLAGRVRLDVPGASAREHTAPRVRRPRKASRPARLRRAVSDVEDLLADYEDWLARWPESLSNATTAEMLAEAIDSLQQAVDLLNTVTPPRGYGRD